VAVEGGGGELESELGIEARGRDGRHQRVEEGRERLGVVVEGELGDALARVGVEHGKLELLLRRVEVDEEIVDLVEDLGGARVLAVDLVDDHLRRQPCLQRLLQHEARLGQRSFRGVHEEEHAVDQSEGALHLATEVGVTGGVHDVDLHVLVVNGRVLRHDRDALLALEIDRVHDSLDHVLVRAEDARLPQHRVDQRGLAVVDVGDDGDVPDVFSLLHVSNVARMFRMPRCVDLAGRHPAGHNDGLPPHPRRNSYVKIRLLLVALAVVALVAPSGAAWAQAPKPAESQKGTARVKQTAEITMEKGGIIKIEFFPDDAPKTVENFITLAKKGYYDGLTFHRVEPGFVVQGGDPKGDGTGGPGYKIKAEFNKQQHVRGVVAMARSQDPDSAGSQFYITLAPAHFLDGKYTVFGKVTSGMNIVDNIKKGDKMKSVKIIETAE